MAEGAADIAGWLPAARGGSREALGRILATFQPSLLCIARRELSPELRFKGEAGDLVQETFLEACRDFVQFHGTTAEEFAAWLRRLMWNNLSDFRRRYRGTAKRQTAREIRLEDAAASAIALCWCGAEWISRTEQALAHDQAGAVQHVLDRLPANYRQVILLRYREELRFEAIGRLMGQSANAAEKLCSRAVERVREALRISQ
jgi:RNA polymerase sigma-70 factor, ECF subfamily